MCRRTRQRARPALLCLLVLALPAGTSRAGDAAPDGAGPPSARAIMERVEARDDGDDAIWDLRMTLIDEDGQQRNRALRQFSKDVGPDEYSVIFFVAPADVKNTGILTYDYDDRSRDDDQWLYLPALKRVKRIPESSKSRSFMGSDFTFADMTKRPLDAYDFRLMEETEAAGVPVWQIEAIPKEAREVEKTGYTKSILFVRKDNYVVVRAVHWVKKGDRLKYFEVKGLEQIDGIWVATEVHMTTRKGGAALHKTVLVTSNVRFGQHLSPGFFQPATLERGI